MIVNIIILTAVAWITVYSISFGIWTWRNKNKLGGIMITLVALIALALPSYILIFL
ncbi:hypothetical protein LY28_01383 [Ruminiclostridium sufflavum DSM 19573]|uniref:Uncharacterized protein n=1 Tax=Ruminiclostridium sufflavum DSM 19573 TaxID=1121337 RepID=A0A318XLN8_9FIRM|nr:hypothetical protein [Ruminiclostridium sufflavum]PYG88533.1 hypothetical protein LY28_01383 [Ruminiclostridium sufflavum DSM 19573]